MKLCQMIFPLLSEANGLGRRDDFSNREAKHIKIKTDGGLFFQNANFSLYEMIFFLQYCRTLFAPNDVRDTAHVAFARRRRAFLRKK
jgi:hypothetical protein